MIVLFCSGHLNTFTVVPQEVPHEGITYYTYYVHACIEGTIMNINDIHEIKVVVCVATKCKWMHPMEPFPIE